jgi:hypothetical protein
MKKELEKMGSVVKETVLTPFYLARGLMFLTMANKAVAEMSNDKSSILYGLRKGVSEYLSASQKQRKE